MKQKNYEKPMMKVVELQHSGILMASDAQGSAGTQNYKWNDTDEE